MPEESNQLRASARYSPNAPDATAVELPSKSGCMGVLFGHAPLVAELGAGDVIVHCAPESDSDVGKCGPRKAIPLTTSVGDRRRSFPPASPSSPPMRSNPRRSTCSAPSSSSTAAFTSRKQACDKVSKPTLPGPPRHLRS